MKPKSHVLDGKTIGIVEDDKLFQFLIVSYIEQNTRCESVLSWASAEEFDSRDPDKALDIVIIDLDLPGQGGISVLESLRESSPESSCIVLTASDDPTHVFAALKAGASGYILKSSSPSNLLASILNAPLDAVTVSPAIAQLISAEFTKHSTASASNSQASVFTLTPREKEILHMLSNDLQAKEIGLDLGLSHETVRAHLKKIYRKLQVVSKKQAVAAYLESAVENQPFTESLLENQTNAA
jgi:DNA-binding NarL/FixJ family response regulator